MGQPLDHKLGKVGTCHRPALRGDLDDAAVDGGGVIVAADIGASDHIEDDVGASAAGRFLDDGDKFLGPVVDGMAGAELQARSALFSRARRGEHSGAEG